MRTTIYRQQNVITALLGEIKSIEKDNDNVKNNNLRGVKKKKKELIKDIDLITLFLKSQKSALNKQALVN